MSFLITELPPGFNSNLLVQYMLENNLRFHFGATFEELSPWAKAIEAAASASRSEESPTPASSELKERANRWSTACSEPVEPSSVPVKVETGIPKTARFQHAEEIMGIRKVKKDVGTNSAGADRKKSFKMVSPRKTGSTIRFEAHNRFHSWCCSESGCQKSFGSQVELTTHRAMHRPPSACYSCPMCPSTFSTAFGFHHHLLWHIEERTFDCSVCEAKFKEYSKLQEHQQYHTSFRCSACRRLFVTAEGLRKHDCLGDGAHSQSQTEEGDKLQFHQL